ncbi:unnamed protein product [Parnassius mnemosyne]|uniref:Uncharacterized protein n=1 Tax=Parnassius mnemosyne TaxID=213953 RepID=A0AAV1L4J4_9NEOP
MDWTFRHYLVASPFPRFKSPGFFYWSGLKEKVYSKPIDSVAKLRERISQDAEDINSRGYARLITRSFLIRCRACIENDGKQFEHLL